MKKAIVVDIDGTIAYIENRIDMVIQGGHRLTDPDFWDHCNKFISTDIAIPGAREFLNVYDGTVLYVSGRRVTSLPSTIKWLEMNNFPPGELYLRPVGMPHRRWKTEITRLLKETYNIQLAIGDREEDEEIAESLDIPFFAVPGWGELHGAMRDGFLSGLKRDGEEE